MKDNKKDTIFKFISDAKYIWHGLGSRWALIMSF